MPSPFPRVRPALQVYAAVKVLSDNQATEFDVLATTPSITPMIKREVQQVVIHQLVATGRNRVTVPWLRRGHGEPQPLTLDFTITPPPAD